MQLTVEVILKEQAALAAKRDEQRRRADEATTGTDEGFNATMELVESGVKPERAEALVRATMLKLLRDDARVKQATAKAQEKAAKDLARREDHFASELTGAYRRNRQPFGVRGAARRRAGKWLAQTLGPSGMDAAAGAAGMAGTAVMVASIVEKILPVMRGAVSEQLKSIDESVRKMNVMLIQAGFVKEGGGIPKPSMAVDATLNALQAGFSAAEGLAAALPAGIDAAMAAGVMGQADLTAAGMQAALGQYEVVRARARVRREVEGWKRERLGEALPDEISRRIRGLMGGGK